MWTNEIAKISLNFKKLTKVAFGYLDFDLDFKSIDLKCLDFKSIDFKISYLDPFIQGGI